MGPSMIACYFAALLILAPPAPAGATREPEILSSQSAGAEGKVWVLELRESRESGSRFELFQRFRNGKKSPTLWSKEVSVMTRPYVEYWRATFAVNPDGGSAWVASLRSTSGTLAIDLDLLVSGGSPTATRRIDIRRASSGVCRPELFSIVATGEEALIGLRCGGPTRWIGYSEREHDWFQLGPERRKVAGRSGSGKLVDGWPKDDGVPIDPNADWPPPKIAIVEPSREVVSDPNFSSVVLSYEDPDDPIDPSSLKVGIDGVPLSCTFGFAKITCAVENLEEGFHTLSAEIRSRSDYWATTAFNFIYRPDAGSPPSAVGGGPPVGTVP